jgi:hypothetical protein
VLSNPAIKLVRPKGQNATIPHSTEHNHLKYLNSIINTYNASFKDVCCYDLHVIEQSEERNTKLFDMSIRRP